MRALLQIALWILPWSWRRPLLRRMFGYAIDRTAYVGKSIILSEELVMEPGARIGHLTFAKGLRSLRLGRDALIGNLNWITGTSRGDPVFFTDQPERDPALVLGEHAALTHRHLVDCTDRVEIGAFTTVGGWNSQILTHSIDIATSRQRAAPVTIGQYCFVGTRVVLLKGSTLPDRSVLAAGSVLTSRDEQPHGLYSGVPAERVRELDPAMAYFQREEGFIR